MYQKIIPDPVLILVNNKKKQKKNTECKKLF